MIFFKKLTIGFNKKIIQQNLEGEIHPGDFIALMGINGVGKSCFLKTLSRINPPLAGELKMEADDFYSSKKIAIVLTEKIQMDFLKVKEIISLGRSPYNNFWGELTKKDNEKIQEILALLMIDELYERFYSELSDGQKQKVLLARALVQEPEFLFLDEPTNHLDIPSKNFLIKILKRIAKDKKMAIFFSTHDLALIEKEVDAIWLLEHGGILHKGKPEEMIGSGLLEKIFI